MTEDGLLRIAESALEEVLPRPDSRPAVLSAAIRYAVGTGGKRIRPLVCLASAIAAGGRAQDAAMPSAAIELLHNYTLVHDDLPSMDNDEMRRGKPSVWKHFGEANAILAADAMQALAFKAAAKTPVNAHRVSEALARAAYGVVAGQVEDVAEGEKDAPFVYLHKTADLFVAAAAMGALAAGADDAAVSALETFAMNLGLAFQYEDDLLDGDGLYPREKTEALAASCTAAAVSALESLPGDVSLLSSIATRLLGRGR